MSRHGGALADAFSTYGVPHNAEVAARVVSARLNGLAGDTRVTYTRWWDLWCGYTQGLGASHLSVATVAGFIDYLSNNRKWKSSSIRTALGGISSVLQM